MVGVPFCICDALLKVNPVDFEMYHHLEEILFINSQQMSLN